jgi:hypothetical protein
MAMTLKSIGITIGYSLLLLLLSLSLFLLASYRNARFIAPRSTTRSTRAMFLIPETPLVCCPHRRQRQRQRRLQRTRGRRGRRSGRLSVAGGEEKEEEEQSRASIDDDDDTTVDIEGGNEDGYSDSSDEEEGGGDDRDEAAVRAIPLLIKAFGWIPVSLSLDYATLIHGVPHTGSNADADDGMLLKANLDSIVFVKFHELSLRISFYIMLIVFIIALPINITSPGPGKCSGSDEEDCAELTDFEQTTIANIPTASDGNFWLLASRGLGLAIAMLGITIVVCYEVWNEWISNLKL